MKIKTSELQGAALDWAVAKCEGYFSNAGQSPEYWCSTHGAEHFVRMRNAEGHGVHWTHGSTDWGEGGPIIERERIDVMWCGDRWCAYAMTPDKQTQLQDEGPTPLIAAMRCYVASKLGDEVDVPEELVKELQ
jgi:hypothetical protein